MSLYLRDIPEKVSKLGPWYRQNLDRLIAPPHGNGQPNMECPFQSLFRNAAYQEMNMGFERVASSKNAVTGELVCCDKERGIASIA
ncbi:hypothetical protein ELI55_01230 [Rhizobium ruizarguesonis]|nr:hypothetical protein ELI55_01230 [Rhizobium ruizarguesonis]